LSIMREGFHQRVISMLLSGEIKDREALQKAKVKLCPEYGLDAVPPNSEILAQVRDEDRAALLPLLIRKPMRTMSGVAVVAVMTSPHPCPHGKCSFCPGGADVGSPQSYTGKEPAARRAIRNDYDACRQVRERIQQLQAIGHRTDKIDLIVMGGTFTSRDRDYQESFVRGCFEAMNGQPSDSLQQAQERNELAAHRCIGLTVETRPDVFDQEQIDWSMRLGTTRVELGVQILDDEILKAVNRGHGTREVADATRRARESGLKVCYHVMPGLPGSSPQKDLEGFRRMFEDPAFRPDMLKFYTTLVIPGTPLYDSWRRGEYEPYDTEAGTALMAAMKALVPEYVRIQRVQRDIPAPQIAAGIMKSNIRELIKKRMEEQGQSCRCIRCREVGHREVSLEDPDAVVENVMEYEASGGKEFFISYDYQDALIGYARLRMNADGDAMLRELKVFGRMVPLGMSGQDWQHRGYGRKLIQRAEGLARSHGASIIRVTSGVGVRQYYRVLGYEFQAPYMVKRL